MQAAIALCHFCETHGPRAVITCQPIRDVSISPMFPENSERDLHSPCEPSTSGTISPTETPKSYGDGLTVVEDPDDRCDACTSLGTSSYLLSNDHMTRTSYISSQVAFSEIVLDRIRRSCTRSLSFEISIPQASLTQKGGPLKDVNASTSKTSNDRDSDNEGEKDDGNILYGDSEYGYTFALTFRIPDTKARGLQRLYSLLIVSNDVTFLLNNHDFFLQAFRSIKEKLKSLAMETFRRENQQMREAAEPLRLENASRIHRLPHTQNLISRRISLDTKRTLQTITGDSHIWTRLHRHMMWTLRAQTVRIGDVILEGVPTQDMLVMMEMDETEIEELDLDAPNSHDLTLLQLHNLKTMAQTLLADGCGDDLEMLLKHVVTGGQVVVESDSQLLCRQFLLSLTNLLPLGCAKMCGWSDLYQHRFSVNLLGCALNTDIPLDAEECLVIRLLSNGCDGPFLEGTNMEIKRRPQFSQLMPKVVARLKQLLLDPEIVDTILETTLRSTREKWLAKAKQFYQLQRQSTKIGFDKATQLVRATPNDKMVLIFWQAGLSRAFRQHVQEIIREQDLLKANDGQQTTANNGLLI